MHLYMASLYANNYPRGGHRHPHLNEREDEIVTGQPYVLESWHYIGRGKYARYLRENDAKVFLDSGAFSAWTLGVELKVADYVYFINKNRDLIKVEDGILLASVLDGIGDALSSYRNQLEMEARGIKPLPCFHAGEDVRYLEYYIKNYEYITLGGMVGSSTKALLTWLDRMWDLYLTDGSGNPRCKVHGFGITSQEIIERYPWWSCDSSSWVQAVAFGAIYIPELGNVNVSTKSGARHFLGQHFTTMTPMEQEVVLHWIHKAGFTYERLSTQYVSRAAFNLWAYNRVQDNINANKVHRFKIGKQELFQ